MAAFCDNCLREIVGGKYVYSPENKHEGKKFCSTICMHEYYAPNCEQCGEKVPRWVYSTDHNDGKKFCSSACMEQHYRSIKKKELVEQPKPVEEKPNLESKSTKPEKASPTSSDKDSNINWVPFAVGFGVLILVIGIIGGLISWLFRSSKRNN